MNDFTVGGTLRLTLRLLARNAGALSILALLSVGVASVVGDVVTANLAARWEGWVYLPVPLTYLAGIVLHTAVLRTVMIDETDRMTKIGDSLGLAFRLFIPVLAISVLTLIATSLAAILLVFPAIMLYCRWIVAIPASVIERCGILEPFRRSTELTAGARWRIFGLLLIFAIGAGLILGTIALIELGDLGFPTPFWLVVILNSLGSCLTEAIFPVATAAIYLELRRTREGALSPDLVAVFD